MKSLAVPLLCHMTVFGLVRKCSDLTRSVTFSDLKGRLGIAECVVDKGKEEKWRNLHTMPLSHVFDLLNIVCVLFAIFIVTLMFKSFTGLEPALHLFIHSFSNWPNPETRVTVCLSHSNIRIYLSAIGNSKHNI